MEGAAYALSMDPVNCVSHTLEVTLLPVLWEPSSGSRCCKSGFCWCWFSQRLGCVTVAAAIHTTHLSQQQRGVHSSAFSPFLWSTMIQGLWVMSQGFVSSLLPLASSAGASAAAAVQRVLLHEYLGRRVGMMLDVMWVWIGSTDCIGSSRTAGIRVNGFWVLS